MANFPNNTCGHFGNNFEDTFINSVKKAASAGPALANAALLVAQGCPRRYTDALSALYAANDLPCPDFTVLFDQHVIVTTETEQVSEVDEVQSILRHIEDVEELPASVNEVLDILTEFDTFEDSTQQSVDNESLLKIEEHQIKFNDVHPNANEHMLQTGELDLSFQDFDDSISFGNSPFSFTAPSLLFPSTPMLSPICKDSIASPSTPAKSRNCIRRITPIKHKADRLNDSKLTPLRRTFSRPLSLAKSMSTLSQATSTPVDLSISSNFNRTQIPSKEIPEDGESFLIISLSETSPSHSCTRSRHITESRSLIKSKRLLNLSESEILQEISHMLIVNGY